MPGPQKQFDQEEALTQAMELFWARGYEGTSMRDIVSALGVNAPSLYAAFGDKRALFLKTMQHYNDMILDRVRSCLEGPGSPLDNLRSYLRMLQRGAVEEPRRGCFMNSTAIELGPHDEEVAEVVCAFFRKLDRMLQRTLDRAVAVGEMSSATNTRAEARFINSVVQGITVFSKAGLGTPVFRDIVAFAMEGLE